MNRLKKIVLCALLAALLLLPAIGQAATLDEIQRYGITVNMRTDGTADIYYRIEWRVLDDTSEGPLEWVKIGVPNEYVDEIKAHTDNIRKIRYDGSGGSFIRIDFDRKYYRNQVVTFEFSIHESRLYQVDESAGAVRYTYTPGWFDDIAVKAYAIRWSAKNVSYQDAQTLDEDGYYFWTGSLGKKQRVTISVEYPLSALSVNKDETPVYATSYKQSKSSKIGVVAVMVVMLVLFVVLFSARGGAFSGRSYSGGFWGGYFLGRSGRGRGPRPGGGGGGCACACASHCACACACAGGGRAGCTAKELYRKPRVDDALRALEKKV